MTLRIEYMGLDEIAPDPRNPKDHRLDLIDNSFNEFGYVESVVIDERTGKLLAGHGRLEQLQARKAAGTPPPDGIEVRDDGSWAVPVTRGKATKDDASAAAFLVAANKIGEAGGWQLDRLAPLLRDLPDGPLFDATGFTLPELRDIDASLGHPYGAQDDVDPNEIPPVPVDPVTKRGDVWELGPHRIMCGDCRDVDDVAAALDGRTINLAVTSPPYADRREYDESSGFRPIPPDEYVEWFAAVAANVAAHMASDGSWLVNIKPSAEQLDTDLYVHDLVAAHVRQWGWHWATEFTWERNGVPKGPVLRLKNQFEPVYQFSRDRWKFRPKNVRHPSDQVPTNVGEGGGDTSWDRQQGGGAFFRPGQNPKMRSHGIRGGVSEEQGTNWQAGEATFEGLAYPGNRLPTFISTHEATGHSAAFPVGLPEFFVRLFTDPGDVVYDPFVGSGSTILAAHHQDRVAVGMELSPGYVDVTCARWQRNTGIVPVKMGHGPVDFMAE